MKSDRDDGLPDELVERVLTKLGFAKKPDATYDGLAKIYAAWCRSVPFDNSRKVAHMRSGNPGALPGFEAVDYLEAWLAHGTGATCWAGAGALHDLLAALGFECSRGVATMLAAPALPPNHGTVRITLGGQNYLIDSSMLCGQPLPLDETMETGVSHPAWGITCAMRDGMWHIAWRPLQKTDGFECRIERFDATVADFQAFHEATRPWSPFNYALTARRNVGDEVVGVAFGNAVTLAADGSVKSVPVSTEGRNRVLVEAIGLSEEFVSRLLADLPTPPPPGSRTAAARE